ncbi:hypothetical protein BJ878DRAFT_144559 [Calycina marina]|uniref:Zn(2)-C6 fungal-type domain-containing protein n=1 Tax=Calycina marina TaxID=1763456 RepID=A0A9P7YZM4_9HELO|nr:hypothetical protein BJ878DRAFT_144559 [Calycina marina]
MSSNTSLPQEAKRPALLPRLKPVACTPCRRVKMRCVVDEGQQNCKRCNRKNFDCFFESHRRGRRPGSKKLAPVEASPESNHGQNRGGMESSREEERVENLQVALHDDWNQSPQSEQSPYAQVPGASLAPAGLLSTEAAVDFSLRNVFKVPGSSREATNHVSSSRIFASELDPTKLGLVSVPIARALFDSFMNYLNPYVCHLDPEFHTFELVQERSPFLLTVLLCVSAKIFNETVHAVLYVHTEKLLAKFLVSCKKSTESVQAICLLTYWKDPNDSFSWQYVGHAIRMATAMNWHRFPVVSEATTELEAREQRNKERTWVLLFVYDRSISLQLGRPWMQHVDEFLQCAHDWHRRPYAVPSNDFVLVAFLQLRMIGASHLSFWPSPESDNVTLERCLETYFEMLEIWEMTWCEDSLPVSRTASFMIKFYGAHFRLLLSSSRLQLGQLQNSPRLDEYVHSCLTSGDYIFRVLLDKIAPLQQLYYVQDSIHVMTAYTTILLVKILLSLNSIVDSSIERATIGTILEASEAFAQQSSTLRSICTDQAHFLKAASRDFKRWKRQWLLDRQKGTVQSDPRANQHFESTSGTNPRNGKTLDALAAVDMSGDKMLVEHSQLQNPSVEDGYVYDNVTDMNFPSSDSWESFFSTAGFDFDNWSLLPLSRQS